jgi:hypothetical protein
VKNAHRHAQRGQRDLPLRFLGEGSQNDGRVHALEGAEQMHDRNGHDDQAGGDADPFPANSFPENTPKRAQQLLHSSSRRGAKSIKAD